MLLRDTQNTFTEKIIEQVMINFQFHHKEQAKMSLIHNFINGFLLLKEIFHRKEDRRGKSPSAYGLNSWNKKNEKKLTPDTWDGRPQFSFCFFPPRHWLALVQISYQINWLSK